MSVDRFGNGTGPHPHVTPREGPALRVKPAAKHSDGPTWKALLSFGGAAVLALAGLSAWLLTHTDASARENAAAAAAPASAKTDALESQLNAHVQTEAKQIQEINRHIDRSQEHMDARIDEVVRALGRVPKPRAPAATVSGEEGP